MERVKVGIVLFDDVEVLDFCGPYEVFSVARLDEARRREEPSPFEVVLVSQEGGTLTASGGMRVQAQASFRDCPPLDVLCVPGGWGTRREMGNPVLLDWLRERAGSARRLASVCTGSLLLAAAGLLEGRRATTHWRSLDLMREKFPKVLVQRDRHVEEDGNLITAAGISAGIDMALIVVGRHFGEEVARATARHMEYRFPDDLGRRVPLGFR